MQRSRGRPGRGRGILGGGGTARSTGNGPGERVAGAEQCLAGDAKSSSVTQEQCGASGVTQGIRN